MREDDLSNLISSIETMDLDALREEWGKRYGAPPPLRSVPLMRMILAWRLQAEVFGGLDDETRRILARSGPVEAEGKELGIGARLTRNWKGRTVEVIVEEGGFRWNGTTFRSLTAAASAIAGSKWNGPGFFGLREGAKVDAQA